MLVSGCILSNPCLPSTTTKILPCWSFELEVVDPVEGNWLDYEGSDFSNTFVLVSSWFHGVNGIVIGTSLPLEAVCHPWPLSVLFYFLASTECGVLLLHTFWPCCSPPTPPFRQYKEKKKQGGGDKYILKLLRKEHITYRRTNTRTRVGFLLTTGGNSVTLRRAWCKSQLSHR